MSTCHHYTIWHYPFPQICHYEKKVIPITKPIATIITGEVINLEELRIWLEKLHGIELLTDKINDFSHIRHR